MSPTTLTHICFFLANLQGGGAERMVANLASGLSCRNVRVDLVLASATGPYLEDLDEQVRVVDLERRSLGRSIPAFIRYLRSERPQIVVATLAYTSVGAALGHALARSDSKFFIREASTPSQRSTSSPKAFVIEVLTRAAYRYADGILAVSEGVATDLQERMAVPAAKIATLNNPVVTPDIVIKAAQDPGHRFFQEPGTPVILAAGRLHPEKGYDTLIKAFAAVRSEQRSRLIILGEGAERERLEALVSAMDLVEDVDLPGFVANPFAYMARAAVFVLASVREGLPGVLIQAMATGCPVVATDCRSGPAEVLAGGRYGTLVPVGDVDRLARAIKAVLDEPPDRESVRAGSYRYTSDRIIDDYRAYFERVLSLGPDA